MHEQLCVFNFMTFVVSIGRRDILGAAETGSGKTLAFGLPILSGIMKLKEKAKSGLDVYDIPYKKTSVKRKSKQDDTQEIVKRRRVNSKKKVEQTKESSEDGYSSGDSEGSKENLADDKKEEYLEEYDVPIKKKETSVDEGNDSDDDNYIRLSDMLDSDDLADTSDEETDDASTDEISKDEIAEETDGVDEVDEKGNTCIDFKNGHKRPQYLDTFEK